MESKVCYFCQVSKPLSEYDKTYVKAARPDWLGYRIGCKACTTEEVAEARRLSKYPAHGRWVKFIPKVKKRSIVKYE